MKRRTVVAVKQAARRQDGTKLSIEGLPGISGEPQPAAAHTHPESEVIGLVADLLTIVGMFSTLNASNLTSGTVPNARFPATLPALSGVNLTALNASNLASGTVPDARFPATLPILSGANLTALNASNLSSGTVPLARLSNLTNAEIAAAAGIVYSKLTLTGGIVNADIAVAAAIVYSKLVLTGSIVNADVSAAAAIAYSKLALTGLVVNADIAAAAAIAYSKLNLAVSIVNADVAVAAAIAYSKLNLAASLVNADVAAAAAIDFSKLSDTVIFRGVSTVTTTGAITALASTGVHTYRFNNATAAVIHGIAAGVQGQRIKVVSVGAGTVQLSHQSATDGTAGNRLICFATTGKTMLAAGVGVAEFEYDGTTARWRLVFHDQGAVLEDTFAAGDYTGSGAMTWTVASGDVASMGYYLRGRIVSIFFHVNATTTVGGVANTTLLKVCPGGFTIARLSQQPCVISDGVAGIGFGKAFVTAAATQISFRNGAGAANWGAGNTGMFGVLALEVS